MFIPVVKSKFDEDICILLKVENHPYNYMCDCGDASELTVKECQNTDAIFISHTHIDHFVNFDTILRHQIGIKRRIIICGPENITQQIQSRIKSYCWNLIEKDAITYEIREIKHNGAIQRTEVRPPHWELTPLENIEEGPIYKNELFQVDFTILDHKTASIAYLFKAHDTITMDIQKSEYPGGSWVRDLKKAYLSNNKTAPINIQSKNITAADLFHLIRTKQGDSLGIIMDHAVSEENHQKIVQLFSNTNKVYIESFYKEDDKEYATTNFHSYASASGRIIKLCKVQEAIPVHFSRKYKEEEVKELIQEFYNAIK